jgi:hypothetical protein
MSSHWLAAHPPNDNQGPVVRNIFDFSTEALGELRTWLEQNPPAVTISSIIGFDQFTANVATDVGTNETTTSSTYVDLATVGPSLSGIPDGKYLVMFGFTGKWTVAQTGQVMSVAMNGAAASDADACFVTPTTTGGAGTEASTMRVVAKTLSSGSNSIVSKYRATQAGNTANFEFRWLVALRYANK